MPLPLIKPRLHGAPSYFSLPYPSPPLCRAMAAAGRLHADGGQRLRKIAPPCCTASPTCWRRAWMSLPPRSRMIRWAVARGRCGNSDGNAACILCSTSISGLPCGRHASTPPWTLPAVGSPRLDATLGTACLVVATPRRHPRHCLLSLRCGLCTRTAHPMRLTRHAPWDVNTMTFALCNVPNLTVLLAHTAR